MPRDRVNPEIPFGISPARSWSLFAPSFEPIRVLPETKLKLILTKKHKRAILAKKSIQPIRMELNLLAFNKMYHQKTAGGHKSCSLVVVVLFCTSMVMTCIPPAAYAQGLGRLRQSIRNLTRPVIRTVRTVIRPTLSITRDEAGPVMGLHMDSSRSFLFTVLGDGSGRLWDLRRGVQLGGAFGSKISSGTIRGEGNALEAIVAREDGSLLSIRPDGSLQQINTEIEGTDPEIKPVLSRNGNVIAYRNEVDGDWHVKRVGYDESQLLPGADSDSRPILSSDGSKIVYHTGQGTMVARVALSGGSQKAKKIEGCEDSIPITAGAFTPDDERVVFGDEKGNICVWRIPDQGNPQRIHVQEEAHPGSIRLLVVDQDGIHVSASGEDARVSIWSISAGISLVTSLKPAAESVSALLVDGARRWIFVGESRGTVGIYSFDDQARIAQLISTDVGWAILDREGRFDGTQNGVDALVWAGETAAQTLPVDAFSDSYFEPGLLGKLGGVPQPFLNEDVRDISEDGYIAPPNVSIDPIEILLVDAEGRSRIKIILPSNYPRRDVLEVRLYHNGKLVPTEMMVSGPADEVVEYALRLIPGENTFKAVGIGPGGVEGQPAFTSVTVAAPEPPQPRMQVVAIGIGDYVRPDWKLESTRNDANAIVSALRDGSGNLYRDVDVVTLLDSRAKAETIESQISRKSQSPQDVLVVFFAGHGYALREAGKQGSWEWYLLPYTDAWNTRVEGKENLIRQYGISSRSLMRSLTKTNAQRVFLILDSCRSGAVVDAVSSSAGRVLNDAVGQKTLRRVARVGGIHILAASRADEDAIELVSVPHGALTYLLLEGIRGAADEDQNGKVSVGEIIGYTTREMPLLSRRLVKETISQKPVGYSRGADFALAGL